MALYAVASVKIVKCLRGAIIQCIRVQLALFYLALYYSRIVPCNAVQGGIYSGNRIRM